MEATTTAAAPSVTMIWHRSCSECQLVKEALEKQKVQVRLRDIYDAPLGRGELEVLLEGVEDLKPFLNPRATEYRDRGWETSPPPPDLAVELVAREPRLLRCPVLVKGADVMPVVIETEATAVPPDVWKFLGIEVAAKKAPHARAKAAAPPPSKPPEPPS